MTFLQKIKQNYLSMSISFAGVLDNSVKRLDTVGTKAGLAANKDLPTMIGNLIGVLTGTMGIIFVLLIVFAGIQYMTAAGDDVKVKKAKTMLIQAVIGMIITVSAYAIASFVLSQIGGATTPGTSS